MNSIDICLNVILAAGYIFVFGSLIYIIYLVSLA